MPSSPRQPVNIDNKYRRKISWGKLSSITPQDEEQSTNFELVVNLKAAKQIGLTIAPNVLARGERIIR